MSNKLYLPTDCKVVVTRPPHQAISLASSIEDLGGESILVPLLQIQAVCDEHAVLSDMHNLKTFKYVFFVSTNAVVYFMALYRVHYSGWPEHVKAITVGPMTAAALYEYGIFDVYYPKDTFDSEHVLALPVLQCVAQQRILIVRGQVGRSLITETLKQRGAEVIEHKVYERLPPNTLSVADIELLQLREATAWIVTSSEAMRYLPSLIPSSLSNLWQNAALFVSHARIAEIARLQGARCVIETSAGDAGIIKGLLDYFSID